MLRMLPIEEENMTKGKVVIKKEKEDRINKIKNKLSSLTKGLIFSLRGGMWYRFPTSNRSLVRMIEMCLS